MMCKKPSRRWVALKSAYLLPLSALAVVAFARPQTMSEIERQVVETAPVIADAIKTVTQHLPSLSGEGQEMASSSSDVTDMDAPSLSLSPTDSGTSSSELPDSNLVAADLRDSGVSALGGSPVKSAVELLDSTMQAVGARKIADGIYVGHFQPSLDSDTVRIADVTIRDRQSQPTGEYRFIQNATAPDAYNITLNAETRKDRKGYYIRYLQPVSSTLRNYDRAAVDPNLLSTDSVLTKRGDLPNFYPVAIERNKEQTRVYMYIWKGSDDLVSLSNDSEHNMFKYWQVHICDNVTKDKYMIRSTDDAYLKFVEKHIEDNDTAYIFQVCLVFPPLGKKVDEVYMGVVADNDFRSMTNTFSINGLPRKGRIITN